MDIYIIIWVKIQFMVLLIPVRAIVRKLSHGPLFPSGTSSLYTFAPQFLVLQDDPGVSSIQLLPVMELVISPRSPDYFYWKKALEIEIWVLGAFIAHRVSFPLDHLI